MFCKNCGSQIGDNQKFCPNCGTPVQQTGGNNPGAGRQGDGGGYQQGRGGYNQGGQPSGRRSARSVIILIIGIVVLAGIIAGIVLGVRSCTAEDGERSDVPFVNFTDPVDAFFEGLEQHDLSRRMEACPPGIIEFLKDECGYTEEELSVMIEEEWYTNSMEYLTFITIDYEIVEVEALSAEDIAGIQKAFDYAGVNEEIQEAKELKINMGVEINSRYVDLDALPRVIKIDGEWYLDLTSFIRQIYTDPVDDFLEGVEQQDGRKMLEAYSEGTIKAMEEEYGYSEAELAEMMPEQFLSLLDVDVNEDFTIDYEITREEDLSAEDIPEIEEFDIAGVNEEIQEGKELGISMTIEADGMSDEKDIRMDVIKIDGEWYLGIISMY